MNDWLWFRLHNLQNAIYFRKSVKPLWFWRALLAVIFWAKDVLNGN